MTAPDSDRFRKAALVLHGLSSRDQAWLLRRLLPATRLPLRSLLRQLRTLGIAPGMVSDEAALPAAAEHAALDLAEVALVDAASVSRAAAVLARQPEQVQAALLRLHAWRWRTGYWDSLPAFQRSRMVELMASAPGLRAAMPGALLHVFAAALGAQPERSPAVAGGAQR